MSWTSVPAAGGKVRGSVLTALFNEVRPIVAVKTGDDTRTTTTYVGDSELSVAIPAAGTYTGSLSLGYNGPSGGTNGRLKIRFNFPTGTLTVYQVTGRNDSTATGFLLADMDLTAIVADAASPTTDLFLPTHGTGVNLAGIFALTLVASAAGTVSVDTAQISASGTTTIKSGSQLIMAQTGL